MNVHVRDSEGGSTCWTRLSREFTNHQEHGLREDQTIAQSFTEMNPGSNSRHRWDISTIYWNTIPWIRTILLNDRAVKLSTAKVCVFPDSVLCLGKIQEYPTSNKLMEGQN